MLESSIPGSLLLPFRLTFPSCWLHRSFRFNSSCPFDTSFPSFQRFHPVHDFLPFVSTPSFRLLSSRSFRCVRPYVSPLLYIQFLTSSVSFHHLQSVCYLNSFVATPSFHSLYFLPSFLPSFQFNPSLPFGRSFRFNSFLSFFIVFRWFQLSPFLRYFLPFVSPLTSRSYRFVTSSLWLHLLQSVCYLNSFVATLSFHSLLPSFRFNSSLPFGRSFRFNPFLSFVFSSFVGWSNPDWCLQSKQPLALETPCGHLLQRPLAATCGHLLQQPPAATCGHSSGCKRLQEAASGIVFEIQIPRVLQPQ